MENNDKSVWGELLESITGLVTGLFVMLGVMGILFNELFLKKR